MKSRVASALLLFLIFSTRAALCEQPTRIHYSITSSLDHAQKTLFEHVRLTFHADSACTDSLRFWRAMIESSCVIHIDSIFINQTKLGVPIEDHNMYLYSNDDENAEQVRDIDSLTFTLPSAGLSGQRENAIEFYYTITHLDQRDNDEIVIPESFVYAEYYPRLVRSTDAILNHDQRYKSFETFSLTVRMGSDLYFMSETDPAIDQIDSITTEYSLDSLYSAHLIWLAYPRRYHRNISIGSINFDMYSDPQSNLEKEKLHDIADAMAFYEEQFCAIPYDKINAIFIALPENMAGGAANNFLLLSNGKESSSFAESALASMNNDQIVIPHEAAHLWWGCSVSITDTWVSEGLASYWADQYALRVKGRPPYSSLHYDLGRILYRTHSMMKDNNRKRRDDHVSHYYKAPYIMNMLSLQMGSENFRQACRELYTSCKNSSPGFQEFKEVMNDYSEAPLDSFFISWIDSSYSQNYFIDHMESKASSSLYQNELVLGKSGKASSSVPLSIGYRDGTEESILLPEGQLSYIWDSPSPMVSVFIDPDKLILETDRSDNARPVPIKFMYPKHNLTGNIKLATSFLDDEPGYEIFLLPGFPNHSERFGWDLSAVLIGKGADFLGDYFMDDVDIARIGYNTRDDDLTYRLHLSKNIMSKITWRTTGNVSINRMHGKYDFGAGIKYGYAIPDLPFFAPMFKASLSLSHRKYLPIEDVDEAVWPERETTPVILKITWESLVSAHLELEQGINAARDDQEYYRYSMSLEKKGEYFEGRAFIGTSGGDAVQERFDPSYEGGMKGYPSFQHYYSDLGALNLLLKYPLVSFMSLRAFGNYIDPMLDGHTAVESGLGLMIGNSMAGLIIDVPAYLSDTHIDGKRWSAGRVRVQLHLISYKGIPKWDFLIN